MKYQTEFRKFITSQYIYSAFRIALAIIIPSVILAHFGLLKDYFLFPLATSFVGLTDMPGPFIRRRNSLILAIICFTFVAGIAGVLKDYPPLIFIEIGIFGIFFSMFGVYGQRLMAVGSLTLVVLSIFADGHLTGEHIFKNLLIFFAGCVWFLIVFLLVTKLQPYKLAGQMIGENYLQLADYLKIKSKFYLENQNFEELYSEVIAKQVIIKNLQEDTREMVFKTRQIVNESTTTSRLLMLMFLNSIDLYEKLMTSENDYRKIHESFDENGILTKISHYLLTLSGELTKIGIALQSGSKGVSDQKFLLEFDEVYNDYYDLRNSKMNPDTLENFMSLRIILLRIGEITEDIKTVYTVFSQDATIARSLSTGLDYDKFLPKQERLNRKIFFNNFSLNSSHFRHAVRITIALLAGYIISKFKIMGTGHSYWILITILAIMRPAFSTTKHRNLLRIYGTVSGALVAYFLLIFVTNGTVLFVILLLSMILCFSLLKEKYSWAVFFMTLYIFLTFNFLNPGHVNQIFKDRIIDTLIAGILAFLVSYLVLPIWEHTQNLPLMKKSIDANLRYFKVVIKKMEGSEDASQNFKLERKDAVISLANLSDNFQRMLSDPKNQQKKLETVHQFVNTSHLVTAYIASLSQYGNSDENFPEIDTKGWEMKIGNELERTQTLLNNDEWNSASSKKLVPDDDIETLMQQRKKELAEKEFYDIRDPKRITHLTQIKNIREILQLLYDVAHEQRKIMEKFREDGE